VSAAPSGAALFVTCLVDQLFPQVGEAAVAVLRRAGVEVSLRSPRRRPGRREWQ